MKTHLVCWMTETGKFEKHTLRNIPSKVTVDKIPDGIIGHWAFNDVIVVMMAGTALSDKIEPGRIDFVELQKVKCIFHLIAINVQTTFAGVSNGPALGLNNAFGTVKPPEKVFGIDRLSDFGVFHRNRTAVIEQNGSFHGFKNVNKVAQRL